MSGRAEQAGTLPRENGASIAYRKRQGRSDLPGIVFLGGFRSDMTGIKAQSLDNYASGTDRSFLRFDYQGHGASSGPFEAATVGTWIEDAVAAFDALTDGPQILVGSSMGGWIMQHLALRRPDRIVGLLGIAVATDFTERLIWQAMPAMARTTLMEGGAIRVPSAYDPAGYVITRALVEEGRRHLLLGRPIPIRCPIRLLHGLADPDVPWQISLDLAARLESTDVTVTLVKDGDHRLSTDADIARLQAAIEDLSSPLPAGQ